MTWPVQPPTRTRPPTPWLVRYWRRWKYTTCACVAVTLLSSVLILLGTPWYKALTPVAAMIYVVGDALWKRWRS